MAEAAPADCDALAALRRLHRARERWGELADTCAAVARLGGDPAARQDVLREEAAIAESRLADPARAATAWAEVAALAPHDAEADAALERLYAQLDRPDALAAVLERRLARAFEADVAARLAELRQARLDNPAGALSLHAELVRRDPRRAASREALAALAAVPGPVGREALEAADAVLKAAGEQARRVSAREARLAAIEDPAERAGLHAEIRAILERDLREPGLAWVAACRAFAEGGAVRASAAEDLVRLSRQTGSDEELPDVYEQAAATADAAEALELRRQAARLRVDLGGGEAAVASWKAVLEVAPDDPEALDALGRLYESTHSAREVLEIARRRAAVAGPEDRAAHLLHAAALGEELGDPGAAADAFRAVLAEAPDRRDALEGLARLLSETDARVELLEVLGALARTCAGNPPGRAAALLRRARLLEADANPRRAVEAYAEILAESPREAGWSRASSGSSSAPTPARRRPACSRTCAARRGTPGGWFRSWRSGSRRPTPPSARRCWPSSPRFSSGSGTTGGRSTRGSASCPTRSAPAGTPRPRAPTWSGWRPPPARGRSWWPPSRKRSPPPGCRRGRASSCGGGSLCSAPIGWAICPRRRDGTRRSPPRPPPPRCSVRWRGFIAGWVRTATWPAPWAGSPTWRPPRRRARNSCSRWRRSWLSSSRIVKARWTLTGRSSPSTRRTRRRSGCSASSSAPPSAGRSWWTCSAAS